MAEPPNKRLKSSPTQEEVDKLKSERRKQEEERLKRPLINFNGTIIYTSDFIDAAIIFDNLVKLVELESGGENFVFGFDIEWPFNYQSGAGKVSLIQLYPDRQEVCYLIQCSEFRELPQTFNILLTHERTKIVGVNIANDIRKLARDFSGLNTAKIINNCIDVGILANKILSLQETWSMERLVNYLLKMHINKSTKLRMSKWNAIPLSEEQKKYAATDAYASLELYSELKRREQLR